VTREKTFSAPVAGYVLAGGASSRFGSDKALAQIGGETVLRRMVRLLSEVADFACIVTTVGRYPDFQEKIVADRWPGEGALGGILTALHISRESAHDWNVIVSCDMPFLSHVWLSYMINRAASSNADVLLPRSESGDEPLCACWRTASLPQLQAAFDEGIRKVTDGAQRLRMEVLDEGHWKRFDSGGRLFWNMNTQQDYEEAVRIWRTGNE
jgi:molybdopterin-guanine dinucleotide biosynthesis protein A